MKRIFLYVMPLVLVLGISVSPTHAALIEIGSGMVYDDVLNITWLQDANYAMTSGYDTDGRMTWEQANTWATTLVYGGTGGWRLPTFDNPRPAPGDYTADNELPSLWTQLVILQNGSYTANLDTNGDISPFFNLGHQQTGQSIYWTGLAGTTGAWEYWMDCG